MKFTDGSEKINYDLAYVFNWVKGIPIYIRRKSA
jgi:hypothetical protein